MHILMRLASDEDKQRGTEQQSEGPRTIVEYM